VKTQQIINNDHDRLRTFKYIFTCVYLVIILSEKIKKNVELFGLIMYLTWRFFSFRRLWPRSDSYLKRLSASFILV